MEKRANELRVGVSDREINALLERAAGSSCPAPSRHYNQAEDFFLELARPFTVASMPIHHDVREPRPLEGYAAALRRTLADIVPLAPQVFSGLTYFFDPVDVLRPAFFQIYKIGDTPYLYLAKVDLSFRGREARIVERSTNDLTATYVSRHLFLESVFIPLTCVTTEDGRITSFAVNQTISQTWIGETGRGYLRQGIWMDADLTRFFSRLFTPDGSRLYPFFPLVCKYKTVCLSVVEHDEEARRARLPLLHAALGFLLPHLPEIQDALRASRFSETLALFRRMKGIVPQSLCAPWSTYAVRAYLNDQDMKEYRLENQLESPVA